MLKKSISVLLALVMIVSIFTIIPVSASAEEASAESDSSDSVSSEVSTNYEANVEFVETEAAKDDKAEANGQENDEDQQVSAQTSKPDLVDTGAEAELTETGETVNGFTYNVNNKEATITAYNKNDTTTLTIPSKIGGYPVTGIGSGAFRNYLNLTEVNVPDTVKSIGESAFANTPWYNNQPNGLLYIGNVLYEYKNKNSMPENTVISVREGTVTIVDNLFSGCSNLTEIYLPSSIITIGDYAFSGCSNLSKITLNEGITQIGSYSFNGCVSLEKLVLPSTVTTIHAWAFNNCNSLTEMTIPKSVKTITETYSWYYNGIFEECDNLKKVVFENGTTGIPASILANTPAIEEVIIPDTVTAVGDYAFSNCPKDLVVYCPKYSLATIYFIDNGYGSISTNDNRLNDTVVLNESSSSFSIVSGAKLNVSCNYNIKDAMYKKASNYSVKIHIPDGAVIEDGSLYLDKALLTEYTEEENFISVPVTKQSGKITFSLETDSDCKLRTYAILNYRLNTKNDYDIIDVINEDIDLISLNAEDVVSSATVKISGIAPVNNNVELYVDDEKVTTLKANKAGVYSGEITLNNPVDDTSYTIKAVSQNNNGNEISAEKTIQYQENAPELIEFTMTYNGKDYDLMSNNKQTVTFVLESAHGKNPFTFSAKYKNPESIKSVYITSTRNQVTKTLKADYDQQMGVYTVTGYFDESNHSYVPGRINIEYTPHTTKAKVQSALEDGLDIAYDDLPDEWKNAEVNVLTNTTEEYSAEIKLADDKTMLFSQKDNLSIDEMYALYLPEEVVPALTGNTDLAPTGAGEDELEKAAIDFLKKTAKKAGKNAVTNTVDYVKENGEMPTLIMKDDEGKSFITIVWDSAKDAFRTSATSFLGSYWVYDNSIGVSWKDSASAWGFIYSGGKTIYDFYGQQKSVEDAQAEIRNSSLSEADKEYALEKTKQVEWAYAGLAAAKIAVAVTTYALAAQTGPFAPIVSAGLNLLTGIAFGVIEDHLDQSLEHYKSGGKGSLFNWSIDPSGYVYAGVTSNRVAGAKVTAWWIPYNEEDEDFWDNPDESKAEIWDASEYSQINPLTTDNDGNYAWDVPEGLWKVVVEKEGYETYSTDWLPVPPPQTDVNINLMSTATPELENAVYSDGAITLTFSQYMDPTSLKDIVVMDYRGANVDYTLSYAESEKDVEGNIFAKEYRLIFDESYNAKYDYYTVSAADVESYSGVKISADAEIGEKPEIQGILGDVDDDGKVTIYDASAIQRRLAGIAVTTFIEEAADADGDGKITIYDASAIQRYLAGFSAPAGIGEPI